MIEAKVTARTCRLPGPDGVRVVYRKGDIYQCDERTFAEFSWLLEKADKAAAEPTSAPKPEEVKPPAKKKWGRRPAKKKGGE